VRVVAGFDLSPARLGIRCQLIPADAAALPALIEAIRHLHRVEAKWLESVQVPEIFAGKTVWDGEVQVFEVARPKASRVYA